MDGDIISAQDMDGQIRKTLHNDETYFSLVDMMEFFRDDPDNYWKEGQKAGRQKKLVTDPRIIWQYTKKRLEQDGFEFGGKIIQLKLRSKKDGKLYATECADLETCLRVVQSIPSPKAEPIREWLARQGAIALQRAHYLKQGKSHEWIDHRLEGKVRREEFTDAIKACVIDAFDGMYGIATNDLYTGLWDRTAAMLRGELGLKPTAPLRDHQHEFALLYQRVAEAIISKQLGTLKEVTWDEARHIVLTIAQMIGAQARQTGDLIGIDLPTNRPLLKD